MHPIYFRVHCISQPIEAVNIHPWLFTINDGFVEVINDGEYGHLASAINLSPYKVSFILRNALPKMQYLLQKGTHWKEECIHHQLSPHTIVH